MSLAVLAAALAGSLASPSGLIPWLLLLPVLSLGLGARWRLSLVSANAGSFVVGFIGLLVTRSQPLSEIAHETALLSERELLFLLPLVQVAAFRSLLVHAQGGARLTSVLIVLSLAAGGGARSGVWFAPLAALACGAALQGMHCDDASQASAAPLWGRRGIAMSVAVLVTTFSVCGAALVGPRAYDLLMDRMKARYGKTRIGFSDRLELGDMTRLLSDSAVVLRVRGEEPAPALLRGAVFSEYTTGTWRPADDGVVNISPSLVQHVPSDRGFWELEHARRPQRYFLPAGATEVYTSSGGYSQDAYGILYPPKKSFAKRVWFRGGGKVAEKPPVNLEVRMPWKTKREMTQIARAWGVHLGSPRERMLAIQRYLVQHYSYSLTSEHGSFDDPIVDFLLEHPQGHCEFFASAMALLGRSVGVPTRLVSGYRVAESSPFGYYIVRRRHAHTWVDAWLDGGWRSFDPTPEAELSASMPVETPLFSALLDAVRTGWESVDDWLERRTTFELVFALAVLAGLLLLSRSLKARHNERGGVAGDAQLLPGFAALDRTLARRGLARYSWESPWGQAARIEGSRALPQEQSQRVAALLRAYAELIYGGRGQRSELNRKLWECSRSLRRRR